MRFVESLCRGVRLPPGYYTRVEGLRRILERFLLDARDTVSARKAREGKSANKKSLNARDDIPTEAATPLSQVVNFGAGADTTCFVLGVRPSLKAFSQRPSLLHLCHAPPSAQWVLGAAPEEGSGV